MAFRDHYLAADALSAREAWAVRMSHGVVTSAEGRELMDFLGYPNPIPTGADRVEAVVLRILAARARGEHIA